MSNAAPTATTRAEQQAWAENAGLLTEWTLKHLMNREDAHGFYFRNREGKVVPSISKAALDPHRLRQHFRGRGTVGLFTTSKDDTCRWLAIDIDLHEGDPDEFRDRNMTFALKLDEQLRSMGLNPLLFDSNGKGGLHLFVIFDAPRPAAEVRRFGLWLIRDHVAAGFKTPPEVFPKQATIRKKDGECGYGNWVRLAGRHHKRDHLTKVWDGESWRSGREAVAIVLGTTGDSFDLVPKEALEVREEAKQRPAKKKKDWREYPPNLQAWDIKATFESKGLWATHTGGDKYEVWCPWNDQHTTGSDVAYVWTADPEKGYPPNFKCHHNHCEGRDIHDVLDFFGKKTVAKFCGEAKRAVEPLIDAADYLDTARKFIDADCKHLVHHGDEFWRWTGTEYRRVPEAEVRSTLWKWLERCRVEDKHGPRRFKPTRSSVQGVLEALKAVAYFRASEGMPCWTDAAESPRPDDVVAFRNGLLDLGRYLESGSTTLMPHTPRWFSENCLPHEFDPHAACPNWLAFLDEVFQGDAERAAVLAQWFGYNLTPDIRYHAFLLMLGPPRSGKGTILRVLTAMLGDFNVANPTLSSLGQRFGLAPLVGKLAAVVGDGHLGRHADAVAILERIKSITGGDPQNVDRKNAAELTNVPIRAKFSIAVNEMPRLPDASAALRSRMIIMPFAVSFEGREVYDLGDRLLAEIPGITNWALRGLRELHCKGRLTQPEAGRGALDEFARLSSPVRSFIEDCCEVGPGHSAWADDMRSAFRRWCGENGHEPLGESAFGNKLKAACPGLETSRPRHQGRQPKRYEGIRLLEAPRPDPQDVRF